MSETAQSTRMAVRGFRRIGRLLVGADQMANPWAVAHRVRSPLSDPAALRQRMCQVAAREAAKHLRGNAALGGDQIAHLLAAFRMVGCNGVEESGFRWCGAFVFWCARQAGFALPVQPASPVGGSLASAQYWEQFADLHGFRLPAQSAAQPGDIVVYDQLVSDQPHDHLGIVVEAGGGSMQVAEGNFHNASGVFERPTDSNIRCLIRLGSSSLPAMPQYRIADTASDLITATGAGLWLGCDYTPNLYQRQTEAGLPLLAIGLAAGNLWTRAVDFLRYQSSLGRPCSVHIAPEAGTPDDLDANLKVLPQDPFVRETDRACLVHTVSVSEWEQIRRAGFILPKQMHQGEPACVALEDARGIEGEMAVAADQRIPGAYVPGVRIYLDSIRLMRTQPMSRDGRWPMITVAPIPFEDFLLAALGPDDIPMLDMTWTLSGFVTAANSEARRQVAIKTPLFAAEA